MFDIKTGIFSKSGQAWLAPIFLLNVPPDVKYLQF